MTGRDRADPRVRRAAIALLLVVAAGALALSFTGLALLGALAGFGALAPVFAVVVDAGTGAASLYWLTGTPGTRRVRYARRLALALLTVSLVGNATAHALAAGGPPVSGVAGVLVVALPWWAAGLVGAIPPGTLAAVVHLLALRDDAPPGAGQRGGSPWARPATWRPAGRPARHLALRLVTLVTTWWTAPPPWWRRGGRPVTRSAGPGWRASWITEHAARGLLDQLAARNGAGVGDGR